MGWSVHIGSIAGTAIRIHFTFLLFLAWIVIANYVAGGADAAWTALVFIVLVFVCVTAHEFGHIFAARAFGVPTPDVTLLPIGGVARLARIPEQPSEELVVAIAGPLVNVAIAILLVVVAGADLSERHLATIESSQVSMIDRLAAVNLFLALFNMIPAFPMDGGRVLRAVLSIRLGHVRATEIAARIGQLVAFGLGFLGLFWNPILIFIAIFVYLAAASESQLVTIRALSRDVPVSAAMMTRFATLGPDDGIDTAVQTLLQTSQSEFPVVDRDGHFLGLLGRDGIIRALRDLGPDVGVGAVMATGIPTIGHRRCLDEAFRLLQEDGKPAVAVIDMSGRLVGLITAETVGEMLMVREALPEGFRFGPWSRGPLTQWR